MSTEKMSPSCRRTGPGNAVDDLIVERGADRARETAGRSVHRGSRGTRGSRRARGSPLRRCASICRVETPARTSARRMSMHSASAAPAVAIASSSPAVLGTWPRGSARRRRRLALTGPRHARDARVHRVKLAGAVDLAQHAPFAVVAHDRRGLRGVRLESGRDRLGAVVVTLVEVAAARTVDRHTDRRGGAGWTPRGRSARTARHNQRPPSRRISSSSGTSSETTASSGAPSSSSITSSASAWATVRGNPSSRKSSGASVQPAADHADHDLVRAPARPSFMKRFASTPSAVPSATSWRRMSPVARCVRPRSALSRSACVPLPAPGGPNSASRAI